MTNRFNIDTDQLRQVVLSNITQAYQAYRVRGVNEPTITVATLRDDINSNDAPNLVSWLLTKRQTSLIKSAVESLLRSGKITYSEALSPSRKDGVVRAFEPTEW